MTFTVHDWQALVDVLKGSIGAFLLLSAFAAFLLIPDRVEF